MCVPCALGVTLGWFDSGLRHGLLGSCPGQYAPLNRPYCESGIHSFASSDGDDYLALPHWKSRATTCHQETSGLFQDAARRPFLKCRQSTETVSPSTVVQDCSSFSIVE